MRNALFLSIALSLLAVSAAASDRCTRLAASTELLYERSWGVTLAAERETRYRNVWEWYADACLKWDDCPSCGHVCPESFWHNYNTWEVGTAYKPAVLRRRNATGRMRFGAGIGSDTHDILGGISAGYEQDYVLPHGPVLFWRAGTELMLGGRDLFRTGFSVGMKLPL